MAKSHVLKALRIFGQEELLKLSQTALVKPSLMKKAAGEELIAWSDAAEGEPQEKPAEEKLAVVLPFKKSVSEFEKMDGPAPELISPQKPASDTSPPIYSSDFMLWTKELNKESAGPVLKKDAAREYAKASEMYVVKTSTVEGKDKIRFASTHGVLVNKKQA